MKYVDEFRDPAAARALVKSITQLATGDEYKFMEVCGGHTHTIYRHGIEHLLPESVELVHGPGCPVCVIPMGRVDDAMWLAEQPNVIFTTFGDMMRVPGSKGNLIEAKARGADVRFVYSPLDALKVAIDNPDKHIVFFAVGFETTAPSTAVTLVRARTLGVRNFSIFCNHVTIVPPIKAILESPDLRLSGFLGPGHVSTVVGLRPYPLDLPLWDRRPAAGERRARARPGLPGLRDPDGPRRRRHRARPRTRRDLHLLRRHDAGARLARHAARGQGRGR